MGERSPHHDDERHTASEAAAPVPIELASGATRVRVAPWIGGALAAYCTDTDDGTTLHWLRPATSAALGARNPLLMACFPLLPYCNRIRDARFAFDGQIVDLSNDGNLFAHALHGHAWRRAWQVGARDAHSVELHFSHRHDPKVTGDWPFDYDATQHIVLVGDALHLTLTATNREARKAMPFGMGLHPYYPRTAHTTVTTDVRAMWHADAHVLPVKLAAHPAVDALRVGMSADAFDLDNNFAGWSRETTIAWPDEHRSLTMQADEAFAHTVIYAPADGTQQLCVEPVSNTTDCFNLIGERKENAKGDPREDIGGGVLQAGETIGATVRWTPHWR